MSDPDSTTCRSEKIWSSVLLAATVVDCGFQIAWFWRFRAHNITMDGIAYIGLARHLLDGNFKASLHGYWSPLTSWIIAAGALFTGEYTLVARLVTIASFLLCLPLLYVLTLRLWNSRAAAALAVFWFSTARGVLAMAVGSILADFILTACVLLYFILLVHALRRNRPAAWVLLGAAHALAFLAKAIAMPWLTISTLLAIVLQSPRTPRRLVASLLLAFLLPAAVWTAWGFTLRTKYGVFTTGDQLRANLMINWTRSLSHHPRGDYVTYGDTSALYDDYMVGETSWANIQGFRLGNTGLLKMILKSESQNVPQAAKEMLILLNPGGALALTGMIVLLIGKWSLNRTQAAFTVIVLISALSLIAAYCMLVFDGRYVIPLLPLLIAICCPLPLPASLAIDSPQLAPWFQKITLSLFIASMIFFAVYWASPFRTVDRDFEASCYDAANALRTEKPKGTVVSIGDGPYPVHGVGFEVGPYVAYMAGWRVIGGNAQLPDLSQATLLAEQALSAKSDAIAVWGSPASPVYQRIVERIQQDAGSSSARKITDPHKGEVGTVILRDPR